MPSNPKDLKHNEDEGMTHNTSHHSTIPSLAHAPAAFERNNADNSDLFSITLMVLEQVHNTSLEFQELANTGNTMKFTLKEPSLPNDTTCPTMPLYPRTLEKRGTTLHREEFPPNTDPNPGISWEISTLPVP